MTEREHPAAKAGRFVRAAGRAGAAAARELERQNAARAQAPPAELPPPPPALRTNDLVGRAVFAGFCLALLACALTALRVDTVIGPRNLRLGYRLAVTLVLLAEASLLTSNWRGANQRLGQRLLNRVWGPRGAFTRREKAFARLVRDALTLIGIAFIAAAVYVLLAATVGT